MPKQNEKHNAEGHYSSLGNSITLRLDIDMLSESDQLRLLNSLMSKAGVFEVTHELLGEKTFKRWCEAVDAKWKELATKS